MSLAAAVRRERGDGRDDFTPLSQLIKKMITQNTKIKDAAADNSSLGSAACVRTSGRSRLVWWKRFWGYMASAASPPVSPHPEVYPRIQEEAPQGLPSIKITQNPLPLFAVLPGGLTPVAFWVMAYEDLQRQEKRRRRDFLETTCLHLLTVIGHAHPQRDATRTQKPHEGGHVTTQTCLQV